MVTISPELVMQASDAIEDLVKWKFCDCGCPQQRSPAGPDDVNLLRIAAFVRINLLPQDYDNL